MGQCLRLLFGIMGQYQETGICHGSVSLVSLMGLCHESGLVCAVDQCHGSFSVSWAGAMYCGQSHGSVSLVGLVSWVSIVYHAFVLRVWIL